jgi:hypothetical protein
MTGKAILCMISLAAVCLLLGSRASADEACYLVPLGSFDPAFIQPDQRQVEYVNVLRALRKAPERGMSQERHSGPVNPTNAFE